MKLVELLDLARVVVPLKARTLREAAIELAEAMVRSGVASSAARLREAVAATLPREVVTVGKALLLHYRTDAVKQLAAALGVASEPLRREQDAAKEARIAILVAAPPKESSAHLQAISAFARALSRREVTEAILAAQEAEDILGAAPLADIELPGYLTVRDVMVRRRLSVRPETTLGEASKLMVAHKVAALPVVSQSDEVLGMVTYRELLRNLLPLYVKRLSGREFRAVPRRGDETVDPHQIPVREVMDRTVLCVSEDQALADVATMMLNRNVERFPVVREGALVGFLTRGDIVRRLLGR
ncbi:MAG: CBS domain-containing protein [Gemmatimonadales bacterium]|nr:CBS domain-containing protein [Gemmatimonadales bacterium]NIN11611.1 CBS domain-containing protein [Gemmatimonadales bacterium]NIN50217.1 CBS domain-containing protein [Gemmatimonadales bacterium]NIP07681.1 CBS domain-containing protein [Gemmatimonadales bacterium]NIR01833.1 CBS domain-containing protein [Gemmatimonadales bacterium]